MQDTDHCVAVVVSKWRSQSDGIGLKPLSKVQIRPRWLSVMYRSGALSIARFGHGVDGVTVNEGQAEYPV